MFLAHFAVGFGAKAAAPRVSLGALFFAAQFLDLLWPVLLLLGLERARVVPEHPPGPPLEFTHYPFSHSLLMVLVWSVLVGVGYFLLQRQRKGAWVMGLAVLSHWLLDLLAHYPDLPLYPGDSPKLGFGFWSLPGLEFAYELGLFAICLGFYLRTTWAVDKVGRWGLAALVGLLLLIQLANTLGPPPPGIAAVAWAGQAQWLLVLMGYWVDSHRRSARAFQTTFGKSTLW